MSGDSWHCVEGPIKGRQLFPAVHNHGKWWGNSGGNNNDTSGYNNFSALLSDRTKGAGRRLSTGKVKRARAETAHPTTSSSRDAKQSLRFDYHRLHASLCRHPDRKRVRPTFNLQQRASLVLCRRLKRERLHFARNTALVPTTTLSDQYQQLKQFV
jgi:hypothetical protein